MYVDIFDTNNKYNVIYADPPWAHEKDYVRKKTTKKGPIVHYDTMRLTDINNLPIKNLISDNCLLFLWTVDMLIPEAIKTIENWGFKYKTVGFYWVKQNFKSDSFFTGMGMWTRSNPEICLLGIKGKPIRKSASIKKLIIERRREHSRKPECVRNYIEELVDGPYLELFARETKQGWDCWGNQINKFDKEKIGLDEIL